MNLFMLSIVINVKNGQRYLSRCLNSLVRFDDVVLLDNFSNDDTLSIAKNYPNVTIYSSPFMGMGKVRNLAASYAKHDWVFFVDCDEILNAELVDCLLNFHFKQKTIYRVRRHNFYDNYCLESSSWENDWVLRLYNRRDTRFMENEVHDSFIMDGLSIDRINMGVMFHFPYENVHGLIDKMQFYSSLYAKQFLGKKQPKLYTLPVRSFFMFIKCYILKRGFLDGYEGLVVSSYNAMGVFSKYIKLYELYYKRKIGLGIRITEIDIPKVNLICDYINSQRLLPEQVIFFVDQHLNLTEQLNKQLTSKLIVTSDVLECNITGIDNMLSGFMLNSTNLQHIVYLDFFDCLMNKRFLVKVRKAILANKTMAQVKIFNKVAS